MGRKQREKKERKMQEFAERKAEIKSKSGEFDIRAFFRRPALYIVAVCALALIAYPFIYQKYLPQGKYVVLETSMGNIELEMRPDKAPKTVANFLGLAESGFYHNMIWHRVVKGFVIQTGDPTGSGTGGAGHTVSDEISDLNFTAGVVGMANQGPGTDDSQFFITTVDDQSSLNGKYTSFATVVSGMDTVKKIENVPVDSNDKPLSSVYLQNVIIK